LTPGQSSLDLQPFPLIPAFVEQSHRELFSVNGRRDAPHFQ